MVGNQSWPARVAFATVCIAIVCIAVWLYTPAVFDTFTSRGTVCNDVDGRCYDISTTFAPATHDEASAMLGYLNNFAVELIRHLRHKYVFEEASPLDLMLDDGLSDSLGTRTDGVDKSSRGGFPAPRSPDEKYKRDMIIYLLENFDPSTLMENVPIDSSNTSFVRNKGEVFAMCLRERATGEDKFHDKQILEFVLIHELSHLTCFQYGHGLEFWKNFKILLIEAELAGMHTSKNYTIEPEYYCSLYVDYNPRYDPSVV